MKCDFQLANEELAAYDFVGSIELVKPMRSSWCTIVDEVLYNLERKEKYEGKKSMKILKYIGFYVVQWT